MSVNQSSNLPAKVSQKGNKENVFRKKRNSKIRAIVYYTDGVEVRLKNRKIGLFLDAERGAMTLATSRTLGKDVDIKTFAPFSVKVVKKWGLKAGMTTMELSQEAMECLILCFSKMIEEGIITERMLKK